MINKRQYLCSLSKLCIQTCSERNPLRNPNHGCHPEKFENAPSRNQSRSHCFCSLTTADVAKPLGTLDLQLSLSAPNFVETSPQC